MQFWFIKRKLIFNMSNCSILIIGIKKEILEGALGPKLMPLMYRILQGLIYTCVLTFGFCGNICTCTVIISNKYLHTTTNIYLFNLAVSDILLLLTGLPSEILYSVGNGYPWILGNFYCHLRAMLLEMSSIVSVLTITAFTIERYIAICHPLKQQIISTMQRSFFVVIFIWLISSLFSLPYGVLCKLDYMLTFPNMTANNSECFDALNSEVYKPIEDSNLCVGPRNSSFFNYIIRTSTFLFFLIPLAVLLVLYFHIALTLWRRKITRSHLSNHSRGRNGVIRMLIFVVIAFFISWAPFHTQRILATFRHSVDILDFIIYYLSGSLFYMSSVLNPIVYNIISSKFRKAFKMTFCLDCNKSDQTNSNSRKTKKIPNKHQSVSFGVLSNSKLTGYHLVSSDQTNPIRKSFQSNSEMNESL